jgi:hypothetical protein
LKNPFENCAIQAVYPSTKHWWANKNSYSHIVFPSAIQNLSLKQRNCNFTGCFLWHWRKNLYWRCLRTGCWGEYFDLRGMQWGTSWPGLFAIYN